MDVLLVHLDEVLPVLLSLPSCGPRVDVLQFFGNQVFLLLLVDRREEVQLGLDFLSLWHCKLRLLRASSPLGQSPACRAVALVLTFFSQRTVVLAPGAALLP